MSFSVAPFEERHLDAAARLLAARHKGDRAREPALSPAFESPEAVRPLIERVVQRPDVAGAVALRDGEPAGFLLSTPMLPAPTQMMAQFFPPRSVIIPYEGHAVASDADAALYRELYGAVAGAWVDRGFYDHLVNLPAQDGAAREAWDSLGFGRELTCAIRDVEQPVATAQAAGPTAIEVHQAGAEDIGVIDGLTEALWQHHTGSPIFAPYIREAQQSERETSLALLSDSANAHFVAYRDGEPLAMTTFMKEGFIPPLLAAAECTYLWQGIVYPQERGGGVGKALLAHAMAWAREQGLRWCVLHFYAANLSGAPFWLSNGFRPLEHRLHRRVDERIAWAGAG